MHECIYINQFGFTKDHSTIHVLISLAEHIRDSLDKNKIACGVFIDLQKAFDTVDDILNVKSLYIIYFHMIILCSLLTVTQKVFKRKLASSFSLVYPANLTSSFYIFYVITTNPTLFGWLITVYKHLIYLTTDNKHLNHTNISRLFTTSGKMIGYFNHKSYVYSCLEEKLLRLFI